MLGDSCKECKRYENSSTPFFEVLDTDSDIMIIDDKPSFYEDERGQAFTTKAGKWLYKELLDVGIDMSDVKLNKAVKCFSSKTPTAKERKCCREYITEEVERTKPKYILALGSTALKTIKASKNSLRKNRGKMFEWCGAKVIATHSPKAVLKSPNKLWEFRSDITYFSRMCKGEWSPPDDFEWKMITTKEGLLTMIEEIKDSDKIISYDIEASSLESNDDEKLFMIGIGAEHCNYIVPLEGNPWTIDYSIEEAKKVLRSLLSKNNLYKIAQNAKFDNRWLKTRGISPYVNFDTFLASYVLNVNTPHGLKYMAKTYLGAADYDEGIEFKKDLTTDEFMSMAKYCALDVYYTRKLYFVLRNELEKDKGLNRVFKYIVMPGERVLQNIEERGVYVDKDKLKQVTEEYEKEKKRIEDDIKVLLPKKWKGEINTNSPQQLAELLFDDLKLPVQERTPTGNPSTSRSALLRLVDKHKLPQLILEYRTYEKALNGFLHPWANEYLVDSDRLHTTYNIARTATGRLSAENPNLQQVPRDKKVRQLIASKPGFKFIEADYSQIELRAAAFIAGENNMKNVYRKGGDIHTTTASQITHTPMEDITYEQRTGAKAVNFGYLYGMWWKSFKDYAFDTYGMVFTDEESQQSRDRYFKAYPGLLKWHQRQIREVNKYKRIRTPTGRIRHLPNVNSPDSYLKSRAERQAINTPVQSFASDMTLLAMIMLDKQLETKYGDKAYMVGQVHDAIMVEAKDSIAIDVAKDVKGIMELVPKVLASHFDVYLDLPIVADVEIGEGWGIGEELEI